MLKIRNDLLFSPKIYNVFFLFAIWLLLHCKSSLIWIFMFPFLYNINKPQIFLLLLPKQDKRGNKRSELNTDQRFYRVYD